MLEEICLINGHGCIESYDVVGCYCKEFVRLIIRPVPSAGAVGKRPVPSGFDTKIFTGRECP